ncbi:hypothetical protein [Mycobacterium sp. 48b]|uniref:hypothetical protein n=1 Tax=Mycobacterium sp. 48b TaxID=3400426 RepID=UPI003AAB6C15
MSYPDPYQPQQPPPGSYPPAPPVQPGPYGYGNPPYVPPNGGYPPAQPYQQYGAQPYQPYYPPPGVPQPSAERDNGNSGVWRVLEGVMLLAVGRSARSFGDTPRARVLALLAIVGVTLAMVVIVAMVVVLMK